MDAGDLRGVETRLVAALGRVEAQIMEMSDRQRRVIAAMETLVANLERLVGVMQHLDAAMAKIERATGATFKLAQKVEP